MSGGETKRRLFMADANSTRDIVSVIEGIGAVASAEVGAEVGAKLVWSLVQNLVQRGRGAQYCHVRLVNALTLISLV